MNVSVNYCLKICQRDSLFLASTRDETGYEHIVNFKLVPEMMVNQVATTMVKFSIADQRKVTYFT